jgi:hypothetical protein
VFLTDDAGAFEYICPNGGDLRHTPQETGRCRIDKLLDRTC